MRLPPSRHPIWTVAQSLIGLLGVTVLVWHAHAGGRLDLGDAGGVVGLGLWANVLRTLVKGA